MNYDLDVMNYKTEIANKSIEIMLKKMDSLDFDDDKHNRILAKECRCCYYIKRPRQKMPNNKFLSYKCCVCNKECLSTDTTSPYICIECSKKYQACVFCGADLELKNRKVLIRKVK